MSAKNKKNLVISYFVQRSVGGIVQNVIQNWNLTIFSNCRVVDRFPGFSMIDAITSQCEKKFLFFEKHFVKFE